MTITHKTPDKAARPGAPKPVVAASNNNAGGENKEGGGADAQLSATIRPGAPKPVTKPITTEQAKALERDLLGNGNSNKPANGGT